MPLAKLEKETNKMADKDTERQETSERDSVLEVGTSDLLPCICPGLWEAIDEGKKNMIEEGAPGSMIADYMQDMIYGQWTHCKCASNTINPDILKKRAG